MAKVHHPSIATHDVETSLVFRRQDPNDVAVELIDSRTRADLSTLTRGDA
jgi:hypothetical protein